MEGGTPASPHDNRRLAELALRAEEYFFNGQDAHWPHSQDGCATTAGWRSSPLHVEKAFQRLKVIS